jgi:hypothetical protein
MPRRYLAALSVLGLAACASQPPTLALTPEQWRADLHAFASELPERHINAFHFTSRDAFGRAVADLDGRLDRLDGDQAFVGFEQIARSIGDGHTGFHVPTAFEGQLPIKVQHFADEIRVTEVSQSAESLLGARLSAIDGVPIEAIRRRILTVTPADEGMGVRDAIVNDHMTQGLFLHGLGITSARNKAVVTAMTDDGRKVTVALDALPAGADAHWTSAAATTPLMRQHPDDAFWCADAAPDVLYCDFRSYVGLGGATAALRQRLRSSPPKKLIIDMRSNGGGNYFVGLRNVVQPVARNAAVNRKGHLFVLIGPKTFSAAMSNSAHFRQRTAAILVGEPIGERPNSYQENRKLSLPNSHLELSYSTRLYQFAPGDPTNEIRPDVPIATAWADYKAGRDPVVDWVIAQPDAP